MNLRYAVRSLRKSPFFLVVSVLSLGLGVALTTTVFSMLDSVRHPYVPFRDPQRLYSITLWGSGASGQVGRAEIYRVLKDGAQSFEEISAMGNVTRLVQTPGFTADESGTLVTANYFDLMGAKPALGRFLRPDEPADRSGVVVGHSFWKQRLQSRPISASLTITIGDQTYPVIGVMPFEMGGSYVLRMPSEERVVPTVVNARLKAGVTEAQARAELNVLAARLAQAYGQGPQPFSFQLRPSAGRAGTAYQDYHLALAGASIAVLLLACANLANLMLVRGFNRRRELALHLALGATRRTLVAQLLSEAVIISLIGAVLGTLATIWSINMIRHNMPPDVVFLGRIVPHLSWRVLGFALGASALSILAFGVIPAVRASQVSLNEPLKDGAATTSRQRHRYSFVVISEVAICLAVLMGAALLVRALNRVETLRVGFDPRQLYAASVRISTNAPFSDERVQREYGGLADKVRAVPGVQDVAVMSGALPSHRSFTSDLEGPKPTFANASSYRIVSPNFLSLMRIPILAGRDFEPGDGEAAEVAIVDAVAAEKLWGSVSPVGRLVKLGGPNDTASWVRVVGVAAAAKLSGSSFDPYYTGRWTEPMVYLVRPHFAGRGRQLVARLERDRPETLLALREVVRSTVSAWDSNQWFGGGRFYPYLETFRDMVETRRFLASLFGFFAGFALVLAVVGLYGVLAYTVSRRMREFGVRVALGAESAHLLRLVLHDGAVMILAGTGIGAWLAMSGGSFLDLWLYDISPTDVTSLVIAEAVLISAALAACWIPARRASRADPMQIIRAT